MNLAGTFGVPDVPQDRSVRQAGAAPQIRSDPVEISVEHQVLPQATALLELVQGHCSIAEERSGVEQLGVALLMFQRHELDSSTPELRNVDTAMPVGAQSAVMVLHRAGKFEVLPTLWNRLVRQEVHGQAIRPIVLRSIGTTRDLAIFGPATEIVLIAIDLGIQGLAAFIRIWHRNTNVSVRNGRRRAGALVEDGISEGPLTLLGPIDDQDRASRRACVGRKGRVQSQNQGGTEEGLHLRGQRMAKRRPSGANSVFDRGGRSS